MLHSFTACRNYTAPHTLPPFSYITKRREHGFTARQAYDSMGAELHVTVEPRLGSGLREDRAQVVVVHAATPLVALEVLHDFVVALTGRPFCCRRRAALLPVLEQPLYYLAQPQQR